MTLSLTYPTRALNERSFVRSWHRAEAPSGLALRWRPGAGQPVVGLHGLGSRGEDLLALAEALPGAPVALIDLPGFGATPGSVGDLAGLAEHLLEALDVLRWERPVWLGCSFGGHVALRVSLDAPERVGALVLADSGGLDPAPAPELRALFAAQALAQRSEEDVARALDALVARPCAATRAYRARRLASHAGGSDYAAVARAASAALADDAPRRLHEVLAPTEVVHGSRDLLVPLALARAAAERLPRARLTVLDGVGHMPWLEAPRELAARVQVARQRAAHDHPSTPTGDA